MPRLFSRFDTTAPSGLVPASSVLTLLRFAKFRFYLLKKSGWALPVKSAIGGGFLFFFNISKNVLRRVAHMPPRRTRSCTRALLRIHQNEKIARALQSTQPLLDQHKFQWHDHGRHPDCQFTSSIHDIENSAISGGHHGCKKSV